MNLNWKAEVVKLPRRVYVHALSAQTALPTSHVLRTVAEKASNPVVTEQDGADWSLGAGKVDLQISLTAELFPIHLPAIIAR